jgi:hypothetical protein
MAIDVEKRRWRSAAVAAAAGIAQRQLRQWREQFGLFPWATAGKEGNRFSVVDTGLVIAIKAARDAGYCVGSAVASMQSELPVPLKRAAALRLNFGCCSGMKLLLQQRGAACAVGGTFDLDVIVARVILGLKLPTPVFDRPPPRLETVMALVARANKYIDSPVFNARCAGFVKYILKRNPPFVTLAEASVELGVPFWMITQTDETHPAWPIAERVRSEIPQGVVLQ